MRRVSLTPFHLSCQNPPPTLKVATRPMPHPRPPRCRPLPLPLLQPRPSRPLLPRTEPPRPRSRPCWRSRWPPRARHWVPNRPARALPRPPPAARRPSARACPSRTPRPAWPSPPPSTKPPTGRSSRWICTASPTWARTAASGRRRSSSQDPPCPRLPPPQKVDPRLRTTTAGPDRLSPPQSQD